MDERWRRDSKDEINWVFKVSETGRWKGLREGQDGNLDRPMVFLSCGWATIFLKLSNPLAFDDNQGPERRNISSAFDLGSMHTVSVMMTMMMIDFHICAVTVHEAREMWVGTTPSRWY